ncbi:BatA domain-containing protein [Humisphaera borealis]|uniref:BatA domain-containing protein n=1 Tax=Humisphaera borealis TaxID=2807512 RepID=A0A7M2WSY3_9BACT|nr:BatA domain-containing protein [Humisphaera borealis]QOV88292.1 BatA domain-containing protein [Humisphaera borealis]
MGLLAPLYFAGLLAIALPIVFHLIRRTPQGKQAFSSLMFLQPSPPKLTKRSRLSNILLLLLRAAALALLAVAFCRPFLQAKEDTASGQGRGRRVAILVDTSASMMRGDLWQQATDRVQQTIDDLKPQDEASLYFFDRQVRPGLTFAEWNELAPAVRAAAMKARLADTKPTFAATRLGDAVAAVADLLVAEEGARTDIDRSGRQLVLVSDIQAGGHIEALQGHQWPPSVLLDVKSVSPKQTTNAGLQLAEQAATPGAPGDTDNRLRVRVTNQPGGATEQFTITWASSAGPIAGFDPIKVYAPAGKSLVVRVPWPGLAAISTSSPGGPSTQPAGTTAAPPDRLILRGDDFDFDNTLYIVPPRTDIVRLLYIGEDASEDLQGLLYYVRGALGDLPQRSIEFVTRKPTDPIGAADLLDLRLAIVAAPVPAERAATLRKYAESGGDVFWVLKDLPTADGLAAMLSDAKPTITEAPPRDYALLARVELSHPLFVPFAEARFADFTKIRFWKHRKLTLPQAAEARTIVWFDDGDPFLVEKTIGQGKLLVATAGWQPADSQLALSTKFVPLIGGLVRRKDGTTVEAQQNVYEPIALPAAKPGEARVLLTPDGRKIDLPVGGTATAAEASDRPGIYRLSIGGRETPLAVNLPADESRTAPVGVEELERWGAKVGKAMTAEQVVERQRQLKTAELESKQKLWRWLIVAVLGFVAAETVVAGLLARRSTAGAAV